MTKIDDREGGWTLYADREDLLAGKEIRPSDLTLRCDKTLQAWWPYGLNHETSMRSCWSSLGHVRSVADEGWDEIPVPTSQVVMILRPYMSLAVRDPRLREILTEIENMQGG